MQPFLLHSRKDVLADSVKQAVIQALLLAYICSYVSFGGAGFMLYMPTFKACEELGTLCEQNLPVTYFLTTFPALVQDVLCCCPGRLSYQRCIVTGQLCLHCEGWVDQFGLVFPWQIYLGCIRRGRGGLWGVSLKIL